MSNDTLNNMSTDKKSISYGAKLKVAREAMGLEQKDIAAQLRLGERIIEMLESGHYAPDVPVTFVRGYLRSYSKLLQIPESELAAALEPIKAAPAPQETILTAKQPADVTSSNYYMQFSTYAIVATLAGMIGLWWYNHTPSTGTVIAQNQTLAIPEVQKTQENKPVAEATPSSALTANTAQQAIANATNSTTAATVSTPTASSSNTKLATSTKTSPHPVVRADEDDDEDDDDNN